MPSNAETVHTYLEGFRRSDHGMVLSCLTDDVEWVIPGFFRIHGKEEFEGHIEDEGFSGPPEIDLTRLTDAGDMVFAEGEVRGKRSDGTAFRLAFCDVFEMSAGKIRRLTSYLTQIP
jgi:ketosteroid isomerase-like protein